MALQRTRLDHFQISTDLQRTSDAAFLRAGAALDASLAVPVPRDRLQVGAAAWRLFSFGFKVCFSLSPFKKEHASSSSLVLGMFVSIRKRVELFNNSENAVVRVLHGDYELCGRAAVVTVA